jgi:hypothetical protein
VDGRARRVLSRGGLPVPARRDARASATRERWARDRDELVAFPRASPAVRFGAIETRDETRETKQGAWSSGELAALRRLAPLGAVAVAVELGRSERSVRVQASRIGVSLRRSGERRGNVLGERVAGQLPPEHRKAVLYGTSDAERALTRARAGSNDPLCPACTYRPIQNRQTGLCDVCHIRRLTAAHREEAQLIEARRELVTARQQKHRARETR